MHERDQQFWADVDEYYGGMSGISGAIANWDFSSFNASIQHFVQLSEHMENGEV